MNRFIYLGRPIDALAGSLLAADIAKAEEQAEKACRDLGLGLFHPARAFSAAGLDAGPEIRAINDAALERCAGMLALWPDGATSFGLPAEVEAARRNGQPVAIVMSREAAARFWSARIDGVEIKTTVWEAVVWLQKQIQAQEAAVLNGGTLEAKGRVLPVRVEGEGRLPVRGYPDDAGLDLIVSRATTVRPKEFVDIECEVAVGLPPTHWGLILGRSSTVRKRGLLVCPGVIDPGYRGLLFAGVWNLTDREVGVAAGERLAQFILFPNETRQFDLELVPELDATDRSTNGFGSTGA